MACSFSPTIRSESSVQKAQVVAIDMAFKKRVV